MVAGLNLPELLTLTARIRHVPANALVGRVIASFEATHSKQERLSGEPAPWPAEERVACVQDLYAQRQTTGGIPPSRRLAIDFGKFALESPNIGNDISAARSLYDFIVRLEIGWEI